MSFGTKGPASPSTLYQESAGDLGTATSRHRLRASASTKPSSQRGPKCAWTLAIRNRKRKSWWHRSDQCSEGSSGVSANWPTCIKMVLIPTVAVVVVVALVAGAGQLLYKLAGTGCAAEAVPAGTDVNIRFQSGQYYFRWSFFNGSAMSQAEVQSFWTIMGGSLAAMTFDTSNESGGRPVIGLYGHQRASRWQSSTSRSCARKR